MRSGDLAKPIDMKPGERYTFTIAEGANGKNGRISVNYDDFIQGGFEMYICEYGASVW